MDFGTDLLITGSIISRPIGQKPRVL